MTIRYGERPKQKASVQFGNHSSMGDFWVSGTTDKNIALATIGANTPTFDTIIDLNGNPRTLFRNKMDANEAGGGCWDVPVTYANTPDEFRLTITNGVQTYKMLQALETIEVYDCIDGSKGSLDISGEGDFATTNVPPFGGAIGVTGTGSSGSVEGVDEEIGKMEFSISKKTKSSQLSAAYVQYSGSVTPSVNNGTWFFVWQTQLFVFAKGSVKFRGCRIVQNSNTDFEIVHDFSYSKGLAVGAAVWASGFTYGQGDQATYSGHLWQSLAGGNLNNTPISYSWWNATTAYTTGAMVRRGDTVYRASGPNTGSDPQTGANWTSVNSVYWLDLGVSNPPFTVGNSAPIIKEGWQYMWPWYRPGVVGGTSLLVPTAMVINRTKDYSDFSQLQCF